jgi:hypothetical protein
MALAGTRRAGLFLFVLPAQFRAVMPDSDPASPFLFFLFYSKQTC